MSRRFRTRDEKTENMLIGASIVSACRESNNRLINCIKNGKYTLDKHLHELRNRQKRKV